MASPRKSIAVVLLLAIIGSVALIVVFGHLGVVGLVSVALLPAIAFTILHHLERGAGETRFALNKRRLILVILVGYSIEFVGQLVCPGAGFFGDGIGSVLGGALVCGGGTMFGYMVTFLAAASAAIMVAVERQRHAVSWDICAKMKT